MPATESASTPSTPTPPAPRRRSSGLGWKAVVGLVVSGALLYFALRDVDFGEIVREVRLADPVLFVASSVLATFLFWIRAWRWRALLRPVFPETRFKPRFAATCVGFMANNLLPARIGEFARAYTLSRLERVPLVASLASLVIERLLDGLTLVALLFLALSLPNFPAGANLGGYDLVGVASFAGLLFSALLLGLGVFVVKPVASTRLAEAVVSRLLPASFRLPIMKGVTAFVGGLGVLRRPRLLVEAVLWSLGLWLMGALSFYVGMKAFDIDVPFTAALFVQSLLSFMVALPSAPGFFGVFEAAARIGLVEVWGGVDVNKAMAFAIGFHTAGFVPVTLIGLYYAWRLGISLREVRSREEQIEDRVG